MKPIRVPINKNKSIPKNDNVQPKKRNISIYDLTPNILSKIIEKTNGYINGEKIPNFRFGNGRLDFSSNFCSDMVFLNNMNISGLCGKKLYILFPYDIQSENAYPEKDHYEYDSNCMFCSENKCPLELRNKCKGMIADE